MSPFDITFLDSYTDEGLLAEIRRVADLHTGGPLTKREFNGLSGRVTADPIQRRFGGWREALERAGVGHLYSGRQITTKMREHSARKMSDAELIEELQKATSLKAGDTLTVDEFNELSGKASYNVIRSRFGSWKNALQQAGLGVANLGQRYTTQECFENLAKVWTHYGRAPTVGEMKQPPSEVGPKAYTGRWNTWRQALKAFVEWTDTEAVSVAELPKPKPCGNRAAARPVEDQDKVPLKLKWKVHVRDHFRCVSCGRSPATALNVVLHADHIIPRGDGGKTTLDNLQTLCRECNLGKGKTYGRVK